MKYPEFEKVISQARLSRYLTACAGNTQKAMVLYRYNLKLSQELFTVISCFEVALRNAINEKCSLNLGNGWLRNGISVGGIFDNVNCSMTARNINEAITKLHHNYSHDKLVAELGFGFWRFIFAKHQYKATGRNLLAVFPNKPISTPSIQYNHTYIFNELTKINELRNRIAHHETICFQIGHSVKSTTYVRENYALIQKLFKWMSIDAVALMYGLDHIDEISTKIDDLAI